MKQRLFKNRVLHPARAYSFTLVEVVLSFAILLLMALMVGAVVPTMMRATRLSNSYELAATIAQKKLDQLRDPAVHYTNMQIATLQTAGIINPPGVDNSPCALNDPQPQVDSGSYDPNAKFYTASYQATTYFTRVDNLAKVSDDGSAGCSGKNAQNAFPGSNVQGKLVISGWPHSATNAPVTMLQATVTLSWQTTGNVPSSYTLTTLIQKSDIL